HEVVEVPRFASGMDAQSHSHACLPRYRDRPGDAPRSSGRTHRGAIVPEPVGPGPADRFRPRAFAPHGYHGAICGHARLKVLAICESLLAVACTDPGDGSRSGYLYKSMI